MAGARVRRTMESMVEPTRAPRSLLIGAGLFTWALAGAPMALRWWEHPSLDEGTLAWAVPFLIFAVAFWLTTTREAWPRAWRLALLSVQAVTAILFVGKSHGGFSGALLALVAGQAPFLLELPAALVWAGVQTAALAVVLARHGGALDGLLGSGGYLGFQLFTLGAAYLVQREALARQDLARANAELVATRALFAELTRGAERLRIARELHDSLGHHLVGLGLSLELSAHTTEGKAKEGILRAQEISRTLMAELRAVVASMREDQPIDLGRALRLLVEGIPRPRVHLDVPEPLCIEEPGRAHALFRCAQEAITNAVRHADAENLWIDVADEGGTIALRARDDGRGATDVRAGNGLSGIRERLEALGGSFEIDARPGEGWTLRAFVPRGGPA